MQFLFQQFHRNDFVWEYRADADGHVTHLFFASREMLSLFSSFSEVLLLDCTYQTNRFGLPLLNMVGISNISTSFYVAFSFMKSEAEEDYRWVLEQLTLHLTSTPGVVVTDCDQALSNAVEAVFPESQHVLCRWHICRSVLSRCKSYFSTPRRSHRQQPSSSEAENQVKAFMDDWDDVTFAESLADYRSQWRKFQLSYRRDTVLLDYLRSTWLPLREKFMSAWVDQHLHLGATTTSRVEGAHAILKRYLQVSALSLSYCQIQIIK